MELSPKHLDRKGISIVGADGLLNSSLSPEGIATPGVRVESRLNNFADVPACRLLNGPFIDNQFLDPDFPPVFATFRIPPSATEFYLVEQLHTDFVVYFT